MALGKLEAFVALALLDVIKTVKGICVTAPLRDIVRFRFGLDVRVGPELLVAVGIDFNYIAERILAETNLLATARG